MRPVLEIPSRATGDDDIPLAHYGTSNVGIMKTVYRRGLGYRYGRKMQTIAGVHFNYSLPDGFWDAYRESEQSEVPLKPFRDDAYFGLLRNYRRFGWLVLYLFGASPAVCKSFLGGRTVELPEWDPYTVYGPHATTLRMSDLGYRNANQASVNERLNFDANQTRFR